jgi:glucosyl-dolichyl phosphate glucuronosyltransferase
MSRSDADCSAVPFVSVVVATRNRAALLAETLGALLRQTWPAARYEILVADNGSTDGTPAVVAAASLAAARVRHLSVQQPGKSHAVNAALACARGAIIAFTDDDVLPEPDWLERLGEAFDSPETDFVAGRILPRWEIGPPEWLSPGLYGVLAVPNNGEVRQAITGRDSRIMPIGANMAVRSSVTARIGGLRTDLGKLDGTLRTGEDHEFFLRMIDGGFRGTYEPAAVVHHWVPRDRLAPRYFRRWMYQNGRDVAWLAASHPETSPQLLGLPRYLWREAAVNACRTVGGRIVGDRARAFSAALRLLWFAGYVRQAWSAA